MAAWQNRWTDLNNINPQEFLDGDVITGSIGTKIVENVGYLKEHLDSLENIVDISNSEINIDSVYVVDLHASGEITASLFIASAVDSQPQRTFTSLNVGQWNTTYDFYNIVKKTYSGSSNYVNASRVLLNNNSNIETAISTTLPALMDTKITTNNNNSNHLITYQASSYETNNRFGFAFGGTLQDDDIIMIILKDTASNTILPAITFIGSSMKSSSIPIEFYRRGGPGGYDINLKMTYAGYGSYNAGYYEYTINSKANCEVFAVRRIGKKI